MCGKTRSNVQRERRRTLYLDIIIEAVRAVEAEAGVAVLHEAPSLGLGGASDQGRGAPGGAVAGGGGFWQTGPGLLRAGDEAIDGLGDGGLFGPSLGLLLVLVLHLKIVHSVSVMKLIFPLLFWFQWK